MILLKRLFLILFLGTFSLNAQNLRVNIFSKHKIETLKVDALNGSYQIHSRNAFIAEFTEGQSLKLNINSSGKIHLTQNGEFLGLFDTLSLFQSSHLDYLSFHPESKNNIKVKSRQYEGDFEITAKGNLLSIVNFIFTESYLEGVFASEAGIRCAKEYYKVQAIISRTFAGNNKEKHKEEGFNLCDAVHCQAYYGRYQGESLDLTSGIKETYGEVLVDSSYNSFPTFFSANCGGQSAETDQIWNRLLPNYMSQEDTFCLHTRQSRWEKYITKKELLNFISNKYFYDISKKKFRDRAFNFNQDLRKTFFIHPSFGIPLRDVRSAFNLRSTFFTCEPVGDKILLRGRGFGHGIGLCQEGAMGMVKLGLNYTDILSFYFRGSMLSNMSTPINHW